MLTVSIIRRQSTPKWLIGTLDLSRGERPLRDFTRVNLRQKVKPGSGSMFCIKVE